ncbi:hypothetical protein JCM10212_001240 [Sporobolomyces blumeae]
MASNYLDPLPSDLSSLLESSASAHQTNLTNVSTIIARLELAKSQLSGTAPPLPAGEDAPHPSAADTLLPLSSFVKTANANAAKESKEWGNAVNRFARSVDKKFPGPPPPLFPPARVAQPSPVLEPSYLSIPPLGSTTTLSAAKAPEADPLPPLPFSSPEEIRALNETIATHLARIGAFASLETFLEESGTPSPLTDDLLASLRELHAILAELEKGTCERAIEWVLDHPDQDEARDLEFALRKEEFVRVLLKDTRLAPLSDHEMETEPLLPAEPSPPTPATPKAPMGSRSAPPDPNAQAALAYGGTHFRHLLTPARQSTICALLTAPLFMPFPRLLASPYGSIFAPYSLASSDVVDSSTAEPQAPSPTIALCASFSAAFLASLGLPKESPLTVVTDVGGSGAMAKIMKVRAVMKEKKTEWSASGELPVEIPLPLSYRYHSIFACPVSKEQSTPTNPPMLLPCGHVIAKESLMRLARGTATLKCPYCPQVSHVN